VSQREVLKLLAAGETNKEISRTLNISTGTVKAHLEALFRRLDVKSHAGSPVLYPDSLRFIRSRKVHSAWRCSARLLIFLPLSIRALRQSMLLARYYPCNLLNNAVFRQSLTPAAEYQ
jgi:hypothetical protein